MLGIGRVLGGSMCLPCAYAYNYLDRGLNKPQTEPGQMFLNP